MEIACGAGEAAIFIAQHHNDIGVMATDIAYSKNGEVFMPNLVFAKAEQDIIEYLPDGSIDYVLLVSPEEHVVGELFYVIDVIKRKLRPGGQVVIKPFYDFGYIWAGQFADAGMKFEREPTDFKFLGDADLGKLTRSPNYDQGVFIWTKESFAPHPHEVELRNTEPVVESQI